jgi:hypothetical protein
MKKLELLNSEGPILVAHSTSQEDLFHVYDQWKVKFDISREELTNFLEGKAIFVDSRDRLWDYKKSPRGMKPSAKAILEFMEIPESNQE